MIYQKNDNSIYIISNDEVYSKQITTKENNNYCFIYLEKNNNILIYKSSCPIPDGPINNYKLNLNDDSLIFDKIN